MSIINEIEELIKQKYINNSSLVHVKMLELLLNEFKEQQAVIKLKDEEIRLLRTKLKVSVFNSIG